MPASLTFLYDLQSEAVSKLTISQLTSIIITGSGSLLGLYDGTKSYGIGDKTAYVDSDGIVRVLICISPTTGSPITLSNWDIYSVLTEIEAIKNNFVSVSSTQPTSRVNKVWVQNPTTDSNSVVHGTYSYNTTMGTGTNSYSKLYPKNSIEDVGISTFTTVSNLDAIPSLTYSSDTLKDMVQNLDANIRKLDRDKYAASNVVTTATANKVLALNSNAQLPASITGNAATATTTTGNAATATALATARTIGLSGVTATAQSFNGTANITIPVTAVPATLLTGTASISTTGNAATADKVDLTASTTSTAYPVLVSPSTSTNTNSPLFGTGVTINPSTSTVTATTFSGALSGNATSATTAASCTGNAATATTLATTRSIGLSGVTATAQNFNGSAAITIPVTAVPATLLTGTASISTTGNAATATTATTTTGNAGTATKLATARTIGLSGVTATGQSFDGSANISIPITAVPASLITGTISLSNLPASALERQVTVTDDTARFALTTSNVQLGDTVKVTSTGMMYLVVDESNLSTEAGYSEYTAGSAAQAAADASGNNIASTYIKNISASGTTVTFTKGDGTTGTFTTQDTNTNTTYAAGTGLSLSGTTFNHSNSVTAGTASGGSGSVAFGGSITIPSITYDAQGHVTGKSTTSVTLPANPNTDANMTQTVSTTSSAYPVLLSSATTTGTRGALFGTGVTINPSTNTVTATTFSGALSGNATSATTATTALACTGNAATATKATGDGSGNTITTTYATKAQAVTGLSFSGRTVTLTTASGATSTVSNSYALTTDVPSVWDANGHLVSPAGWTFYITNDAYNS